MKITNSGELDAAILELEQRRKFQETALIDQFNTTYQSLRPVNLIKGAIADIAGSEEIRDKVINAAIGVGTGFLTKKILMGKSNSIFKKILGGAMEFGVANIVANHTDDIKNFGSSLFNKFFSKNGHKTD